MRGNVTMQLSQGEKVILLMLCEIQKHLKIKGETNTKLIEDAIFSGNLWGLEWGMTGVFHGSETPEHVVTCRHVHVTRCATQNPISRGEFPGTAAFLASSNWVISTVPSGNLAVIFSSPPKALEVVR
jgi:hypothetical protein